MISLLLASFCKPVECTVALGSEICIKSPPPTVVFSNSSGVEKCVNGIMNAFVVYQLRESSVAKRCPPPLV